jgi:hypothetical protein
MYPIHPAGSTSFCASTRANRSSPSHRSSTNSLLQTGGSILSAA